MDGPTWPAPAARPRPPGHVREVGPAVAAPYEVPHETRSPRGGRVARTQALRLSNREKLLCPVTGFTKGRADRLLRRDRPFLLRHLAGHPVTLKRYPDGVNEPYFSEALSNAPPRMGEDRAGVERATGGPIDYCLVEDLPTLIWAGEPRRDRAAPAASRGARDMDTPTSLVFDLDPGGAGGGARVLRRRAWIGSCFDDFGLRMLREELRRQGDAGLSATQHRRPHTSRPGRLRGPSRNCWRSSTPSSSSRA